MQSVEDERKQAESYKAEVGACNIRNSASLGIDPGGGI